MEDFAAAPPVRTEVALDDDARQHLEVKLFKKACQEQDMEICECNNFDSVSKLARGARRPRGGGSGPASGRVGPGSGDPGKLSATGEPWEFSWTAYKLTEIKALAYSCS